MAHFKDFLFENILNKLESKLKKYNSLYNDETDENKRNELKILITTIEDKINIFINETK